MVSVAVELSNVSNAWVKNRTKNIWNNTLFGWYFRLWFWKNEFEMKYCFWYKNINKIVKIKNEIKITQIKLQILVSFCEKLKKKSMKFEKQNEILVFTCSK